MPEVKLRLNLDTEEVELTYDGEVALTSGKDVLHSWVKAINDKHYVPPVVEPAATEPVSVETPVEDKVVTPEGPANEEPKEVVAEVDKPSEPVVD